MACGTTLCLDDSVLILEWPGHFSVALGADDVLLCGRALKLLSKAAVGLVTVGAQDQAFYYLVTERRGELGPLILMTLKAEVRLSVREEMFRFTRRMDAMATNTAHITLAMSRALIDHVLAGVALQAAIVYLCGWGLCRIEYL